MFTRWQVQSAPTAEDPMRRLLLLKASAADVQVLIRKLGAVCGRPKKDAGGAEFNFRIYLHGITEDRLPAIEADLQAMTAPGAAADVPRSPTPLPKPKEEAPPAKMPEIPRMATPPPRMATPPPAPKEEPAPDAAIFDLSPGGSKPKGEPSPEISAVAPPKEAPPVESTIQAAPLITLRSPGGGGGAPPPAQTDGGPFSPGAPSPAAPELVVPGRMDMPAFAPTPTADAGRFGGLGAPPPKRSEPAEAPKPGAKPPAHAPQATPESAQDRGASAPPEKKSAAAAPKPAAAAAPVLETEDSLFGGRQRLDPLLSMETLTVSAANRFAHAATTSVISSPGGMYNPLFISGSVGTGKTHMLHALGQKLESSDPPGKVWLTTGPKLARAAALAVSQNKSGQLEEFAKQAKALLIDDVQLMGVAEQNRGLLAQILKIFSVNGKQVVMASAYSHRMLGALEKALEYQISAGHAVELKIPPDKKRKEIALHVLERTPMSTDTLSLEQFGDRIVQDFGSLETAVRRLLALKDMGPGKGPSLKDMLATVFAPDAGEAMPSSEDEIKAALSSAPALPPEGTLKTAILYPALQDTHADWIWCHVLDTARQRKWPTPFRMAHRKAYTLEQVFAAPFVVAEECYQAGVRAALVLGPPPGSDLSEHEADFRYVAEHLLRDMGVSLGWIPYNRVRDPKYAALAYLDLCRSSAGTV
ncbi:MAG: hypothetical protein A2X36_08520 [Elusimicrobia bacterium GWA2_69_24]|nr:MAG: hypothetical protein A2X36_08520 [Elusimicrobia bacterium GWA2_69_24]HBL16962.1 hypothetical protein [Elusimicrobiota bacterium]